jgi:hypothetical protein
VKQIADRAGISERAVHWRLERCVERLGAASIAHAVAIAFSQGLLLRDDSTNSTSNVSDREAAVGRDPRYYDRRAR